MIDSSASSPSTYLTEDENGFDLLKSRLMALQQEIRSLKIPVVIVFEGLHAAGKGMLLGELLEGLDPRGYKVHTITAPTAEELRYPSARRYWERMPSGGNIALFLGSWYREVANECLKNKQIKEHLPDRYAQIVQMESQLIADGTLLIKFFFNISKKEQKKRLKKLESKKSTRWRVTKEDWFQHENYDNMLHLYDAMMAQTHFDGALWHVLRCEKKSESKLQMYTLLTDAFEATIAERKAGERAFDTPTLARVSPLPTLSHSPLSSFSTEREADGDYKASMDAAQKQLRKLHNELYRKQIPMVIAFEGWDAAGKGGSIRRLTSALDPRGFEVIPIAAPTTQEKSHHHLWRFWTSLPKDGHIAIFDRTWYGRVMVERIEGFCTTSQWQRAYTEINQFEWELYTHGTIVRKFWLQISQQEQLRRFEARQQNPEKQWKITDEDWRNREKWPQYEQAVNDMLSHTHTAYAPWVVVEGDNKKYARLKVLHEIIQAIEEVL